VNKTSESRYDIAGEAISDETEVAMGNAIYETVYEFFEKQVTEQAPKKLSLLTAETPFDDIGMDSLEKLSVAMDLEEHFDLFIPDEDIGILTNIQGVVNYLELAIAKRLQSLWLKSSLMKSRLIKVRLMNLAVLIKKNKVRQFLGFNSNKSNYSA
jgi:acyl carrier protein